MRGEHSPPAGRTLLHHVGVGGAVIETGVLHIHQFSRHHVPRRRRRPGRCTSCVAGRFWSCAAGISFGRRGEGDRDNAEFVLQKPLLPGVKIYPPLRCATSATGSTSRRGGRLCGVTSSEHRSRRARRGHSACLGESHECLGHLRAGHQVGWNARITFRRSPQDILLQYPASLSLCGTCRPRPLSYP